MNIHVFCEKKAQELRFLLLHIALTIFQALDDQGDISLLERIHHASAFPFDTEDALQSHILQVMGSQGLLTGKHFTDFRNR